MKTRVCLVAVLVLVCAACAEQTPRQMVQEHERIGSHHAAVTRGEAMGGLVLLLGLIGGLAKVLYDGGVKRMDDQGESLKDVVKGVTGVNSRLDTLNGQVAANTRFREDQYTEWSAALQRSAVVNEEVLQELRRKKIA